MKAATGAGSGRVLALDVLRGLSIAMVLSTHTAVHPEVHSFLYTPLVFVNRVGWSGVDIFFVLSGYLVGGLLMREFQQTGTLAPGRFWLRRGFKVWPTYYAFLITFFVIQTLFGKNLGDTYGARAWLLFRQLWPNLLHVQNYFSGSPVLGWLWSLAVEEHFYLLLPWALATILGTRRPGGPPGAIGKRMTICFAALGLGCLALRALTRALAPTSQSPFVLAFPTHLRIDALFAGVFLAYLVRFHDDKLQRLRPFRHVILAASIGVWVLFYQDTGHQAQLYLYPFGQTLLYLGAAGLVLFAHFASATRAEGGPVRRALELPMQAFAWLGVRSYAIYVWHGYYAKPIASRVTRLLGISGKVSGLEGWAHDLIYFGSYVLLGAIMFRLVELPGLKMRERVAPPTVPSGSP